MNDDAAVEVDPSTGYVPGREPGSPYWDGPAGDEMRRLERLALEDLAAREVMGR